MTTSFDLGPFKKARFIDRPNRFLVRCDIDGIGVREAFLANPGRLLELLLPSTTMYVTDGSVGVAKPGERRTKYTVLAVERDGHPILLHTHLTNQVARTLIERQRIEPLANAKIVKPEYTVGKSRFDFLLRDGRRQVYLEVKSCTLYGNSVAMFPDAVTSRGRKHLVELASLRSRAVRPCVLFVIHTRDVQWFMPDFHTDLEFSKTLLEVRKKVDIIPIVAPWTADLELEPSAGTMVPIPWRHLRREVQDRGSYLLILKLPRKRRIQVGSLGELLFEPGYYTYVGSAMQHMKQRLARHARRRKNLHWHIDYLRDVTETPVALPIRSSLRQECELARRLAGLLAPGPENFGASDCRCPQHLFWSLANPLENPAFHQVLQQFRMRHPEGH